MKNVLIVQRENYQLNAVNFLTAKHTKFIYRGVFKHVFKPDFLGL
jgi:hypothetical protein